MFGDLSAEIPFEPLLLERGTGTSRAHAARPARSPRPLSLAEFPSASLPVQPPSEAQNAAAPRDGSPNSLLFSEEELARVLAALSVQLRLRWEEELRAQLDELARSLQARLLEAFSRATQVLREQRNCVARTAARAVTAALEALVPQLRKEQRAAALELLLEQSLASRPLGPLVIEAPAADLPELQACVPALLAAAGAELAYEVRPLTAEDSVLRVRWQESWAEIDLEAWARAVIERVHDFLEGRAILAPTLQASQGEQHGTG